MIRNDLDPGPDLADHTPDREVGRDRGAELDPDSDREVDRNPTIGIAAVILAVDPILEVALAHVSVPTRGPIREVERIPETEISRGAKTSREVKINRGVCPDRDPKARFEKSSQKT